MSQGFHAHNGSYLDTSAILRKATISPVMYVSPSVRMEQLGSLWTNFDEILHLSIFRKAVEKIKIS
jgi:hypothetical protein